MNVTFKVLNYKRLYMLDLQICIQSKTISNDDFVLNENNKNRSNIGKTEKQTDDNIIF